MEIHAGLEFYYMPEKIHVADAKKVTVLFKEIPIAADHETKGNGWIKVNIADMGRLVPVSVHVKNHELVPVSLHMTLIVGSEQE